MRQSNTPQRIMSHGLAIVVLLAMAAVFVSLGFWQLQRGTERERLAADISMGRQRMPQAVTHQQVLDQAQAWQGVRVSGEWRDDLTVLLENRNYQGQSGYWVATPFLLQAQALRSNAILVLRGWLPRPAGQPVIIPPAPTGSVQIDAEVWTHVPRLYELPGQRSARHGLPEVLPSVTGSVPVVQNLYVNDLAQSTQLSFQHTVLAQISPSPGLGVDWPLPNLNYHQNRGYALQWFGFAVIAMLFCLWLVYGLWFQHSKRALGFTRTAKEKTHD